MPTRSSRLRPRKEPRQQRSHETRDRILVAAARVFSTHGYAAGTTNKIAVEASISIGSLYQYFPNKDSILLALMRQHVADGADALQQIFANETSVPSPLEDRVASFVDVALATHVGDARLHQVLFEEAPRPREFLDELHALEEQLVAAVASLLRSDPEVRVNDYEVAGRLVVVAVESLVHRFVSTTPTGLDTTRFRTEVVTMLTRYLTSSLT